MTDETVSHNRRVDDPVMVLIQELLEGQKQIHADLLNHAAEETAAFTKFVDDGFPNGDPSGHRRMHEAIIVRMEDRAKFWKQMLFEVSKYGLFGVLGWLAYVAWIAFLQGPKNG